eukprot:1869537-Prymnesium_polylepis.1
MWRAQRLGATSEIRLSGFSAPAPGGGSPSTAQPEGTSIETSGTLLLAIAPSTASKGGRAGGEKLKPKTASTSRS